jgi:hypothetical protein
MRPSNAGSSRVGTARNPACPERIDDLMRHFRSKPGHNCWQVTQCKGLAVLVDGESYFADGR